jgi:hypothetical protein
VVGRGLVMLGLNSIVWVILSEVGKDFVRFGKIWGLMRLSEFG